MPKLSDPIKKRAGAAATSSQSAALRDFVTREGPKWVGVEIIKQFADEETAELKMFHGIRHPIYSKW